MPSVRWGDIVEAKRAKQLASIPKEWILSSEKLPSNRVLDVTDIPAQSDLFTSRELEITTSAAETILSRISGGESSSLEVTTAFCKRAALAHQLVNCLTEIFFEDAIQRAIKLDAYYKKTGKTVGPLHGLPISVKDQVNVKGIETTLGYVYRVGNVAKKNAVIVDILISLGAIPYVKTNSPQTMIWEETMNNLFGRTLSPLNRSFTSAGSSGGEGSLVGFRGSPLGLGTDVGGSIRVPAAYAGIYGLRPSYGRLPFAGIDDVLDGQESIKTVVGPLATSLKGIEILMKSVIEKEPWVGDPLAVRKPWNEDEHRLLDRGSGKGLCFAIMWDDGITMPHPPITRGLEMTRKALAKAGHRVIVWKPPIHHIELSRCMRDILLSGIIDDIRGDIESSGEPLITHMAPEGQTPEHYRRLPEKSASVYEVWQAQKRRRTLREEYWRYWSDTVPLTGTGRPADAIIAPVNPTAGAPHGKSFVYDYTNAWNVLDYPALTMPVAKVDPIIDKKVHRDKFFNKRDSKVWGFYDPQVYKDAPIAVQLIGRTLEEEALIGMGKVLVSALAGNPKVHSKL